MDLATILKLIEVIGPAADAAKAIFDAALPLLTGSDQDELKRQYAAARQRSDALHDDIQRATRG